MNKITIKAAHDLEVELNQLNIECLAGLQENNNELIKSISREIKEIADKLEKPDKDTLYLFVDFFKNLGK